MSSLSIINALSIQTNSISESDELRNLNDEIVHLERAIPEKRELLEAVHSSLSTSILNHDQALALWTQSLSLQAAGQHLATRLEETKKYKELSTELRSLKRTLSELYNLKKTINTQNSSRLIELTNIVDAYDLIDPSLSDSKNEDRQICKIQSKLNKMKKKLKYFQALQSTDNTSENLFNLSQNIVTLESEIFNIENMLKVIKNHHNFIDDLECNFTFPIQDSDLGKVSPTSADQRIIELKYKFLPNIERRLASLTPSQDLKVLVKIAEEEIKKEHLLKDLEILDQYNLKAKSLYIDIAILKNNILEQELIGKVLALKTSELTKILQDASNGPRQ